MLLQQQGEVNCTHVYGRWPQRYLQLGLGLYTVAGTHYNCGWWGAGINDMVQALAGMVVGSMQQVAVRHSV